MVNFVVNFNQLPKRPSVSWLTRRGPMVIGIKRKPNQALNERIRPMSTTSKTSSLKRVPEPCQILLLFPPNFEKSVTRLWIEVAVLHARHEIKESHNVVVGHITRKRSFQSGRTRTGVVVQHVQNSYERVIAEESQDREWLLFYGISTAKGHYHTKKSLALGTVVLDMT